MKKYLLLTLGVVSASVFTSGCLVVFPSYKQNVTLQTATTDGSIIHGTDTLGATKVAYKANKNIRFDEVMVHKPGYKTRNYCFERNILSPVYALSVLDIALLGPFWEYRYPTCQKYADVQNIPALLPLESRQKDEKYMLVNNVAVDIKAKNFTFKLFNSIKNLNRGNVMYKLDSNSRRKNQDLQIENTVYSEELNVVLKNMNFIDTTRTIFPDHSNTVYLNATVRKVAFNEVSFVKETDRHLLSSEIEIEWDLLDYYKQKVFTTVTTTSSDLFMFFAKEEKNRKGAESIVNKVVNDNMEYALIDLKGKLKDKGLLKMTTKAEDSMALLTFNAPQPGTGKRLNDFLKSTVSIKVDDGHGSGVILTDNGYIVTNYHVVVGSKKLEVIFNDGTKADATVIRKSEDADLALIKVSRDSLAPLALSTLNDPDIGNEVWAIGTPKSLELGQSVSKGIISGIRKTGNDTYLQTDVKISPGNSGGALVNKDGTVLGIVSAKLISLGTEGVGFAIPASEVFKKLKIQYK